MEKENFDKIQNLESKEKEPKPEKVALLVRHPSVEWLEMLFEKAELEDKDVETHVPIDKEGLKMTGLLSEYLQKNLPQILEEKSLDKKYSIYTSPIKRAKSMASIVSKNLKLSHTENPEIPIPVNNDPIQLDYLAEVPWIDTKQEALDLIKEAKEKNMHPVKLWFEKNPDEIIKKLNEKLLEIEKGLKSLEDSNTSANILFTHRIIIGLTLWSIEQKKLGREDLTITKDDLPKIMELTGKVAYTSLSEIRLQDNEKGKQWSIHSISETPHLDREPKLRKGIF